MMYYPLNPCLSPSLSPWSIVRLLFLNLLFRSEDPLELVGLHPGYRILFVILLHSSPSQSPLGIRFQASSVPQLASDRIGSKLPSVKRISVWEFADGNRGKGPEEWLLI
ncbi:hypothetical protein NE237_024196 [Protea cynaroides]|uniref:Uncharacterized protein n=1 Tax=Protea cynaroides TaxID=273540 RepID=A0A9Q0HHL7_9MAGN|nr:hypothetical protein NE237_024196 [Protea cynaroides]